MNGADAAENAGAAEDDRGDGQQLVTEAGVGFGGAEARTVSKGGHSRDDAGECVCEHQPALDWDSGVARAFGSESDRAKTSTENRSMHDQPSGDGDSQKNP